MGKLEDAENARHEELLRQQKNERERMRSHYSTELLPTMQATANTLSELVNQVCEARGRHEWLEWQGERYIAWELCEYNYERDPMNGMMWLYVLSSGHLIKQSVGSITRSEGLIRATLQDYLPSTNSNIDFVYVNKQLTESLAILQGLVNLYR